ncbi:MAG TPA: erythromycin esterase family protein [Thermomicrobiales bacterium]|nr:erythromycin esterase family protein [Thermomicrobiales bacterium]
MPAPYRNRRDAGRRLAAHLARYANRPDTIVLGLPRGGLPVAAEVARDLDLPLDAFLVRKLGVPGHEELAMGAIASGGLRVLNGEVVSDLRIPPAAIDAVEAMERRELQRRERLYRGGRGPIDVAGKTVILVDDGLATGSTMRAAAEALRLQHPARIVGAVPVGSPAVCEAMTHYVDEMVCGIAPESFYAVGLWYDDFAPTTDAEAQAALNESASRQVSKTASRNLVGAAVGGGSGAAGPAGQSAAVVVDADAPPGAPWTEHRVPPTLAEAVRTEAWPLLGGSADYDWLIEQTSNEHVVLIGEASHGTVDFYQERIRITRRLIEEHGFSAVAVEADWPDAYRVNCFVRARGDDPDAAAALGDFQRFPRWLWRNEAVLEFVDWLRSHNDALPRDAPRVGFYGMDLYSLSRSIAAVIDYLDKVDPDAAKRARARYACFDHFSDDPQMYGYATTFGVAESCENEAVGQLMELQRRAGELARRDGRVAEDDFFFAEQNARLARDAEAYYRAMFRGRVSSWNLRDRHMADTLGRLMEHLGQTWGEPKVVVWAHNSHLGDARATDMAASSEVNVGQLVRERWGVKAWSIGMTTFDGTVTAASDWDGPARRRRVRPALADSWERIFHDAAGGQPNFQVGMRDNPLLASLLAVPRLERAIGVVYRPETERMSHYFDVRLSHQFDTMLHFDHTEALRPLDRDAGWETPEELPETFPTGI